MMRITAMLLSLMFLGAFLCGCGRTQGDFLIIGREEDKAGSVPVSSLSKVKEQEENTAPDTDTEIRVFVCGAVKNPGVVTLQNGDRVEDALKEAGGFSEDADRNAVNLAEWVSDGQQIYFLTTEEAEEQEQGKATAESGLIDINTADAAVLCTLPGIGESRAQDIIAYREQSGGFENIEDIMKVSGIKTSVFAKIRDKITVK